MRETRRRGERRQRNGPGPALGHGPGSVPVSLPRPVARDPGVVAERPLHAPLPTDPADLPELDAAVWPLVNDGLSRLQLELSPGARGAIDAHARLMLGWNRAVNLTALRQPEQLAVGHVLDSLTALPVLRQASPRRILDLGSGGGYPGLPVAVALPAETCALVDSVAKKARFLTVAAAAAGNAMRTAGEPPPSWMVLGERAEDLADEAEHRSAWDAVLVRAVGSVAEVAELGLPLLAVGGRLIVWKRDNGDGSLGREIEAAGAVIRAVGGTRPEIRQIPPADRLGLAGHVLVVVDKIRSTPDRFPRPPAERRRSGVG